MPFSYTGVHLAGPDTAPTMTVTAYASSAASTILPQTPASTLAAEIAQIRALWPAARLVVVGHSEGGYVAEQYFMHDVNLASEPDLRGIFSLDSPIDGIRNGAEVAALLKLINLPTSPALLAQLQTVWNDAAANGAAISAKDAKTERYVAVGTANDNRYRVADDPVAGLTSQVVLGADGQPAASPGTPNQINPAAPPLAGIGDPLGVLASHQCVMDSGPVITSIVDRVRGR